MAIVPMSDLKGYLTEEQVNKILSHCNTLQERAIIETLWRTGIRVSELINLKREDILWDERIIIITWLKKRGKTKLKRRVPISRGALDLIKQYLKTHNDERVFPISRQRVHQIVRRTAERVGIYKVGSRYCHPHTYRHCLHPNTRIFLKNKIISARQLFFMEKSSVKSFDFNENKIKNSKIIGKGMHKGKLIRIKAGGYEILCSPEHRLFCLTENGISEIKAKDIKKGFYLAGIKHVKIKGRKTFGKKLSRLIGYFIGDGCAVVDANSIYLYDKDKKIIDFYKKIIKTLFMNINTTIKKHQNSYKLTIYFGELSRFFDDLDLIKLQKYRRCPKEIFEATDSEIKEFLAGFYDAEGWKGYLTSSSKELIKDIQMLLLRLGIDSHLYEKLRTTYLPQRDKNNKKKRIRQMQYTLNIIDKSKFFNLVPTLKNKEIKTPLHKYPIQTIFKQFYKKHINKGYISSVFEKYGLRTKRFTMLSPTKKTLEKIIKAMKEIDPNAKEVKLIEKIMELDNIKWLKVSEISVSERKINFNPVLFDFTIENQNFITDGFISHNSFAINWIKHGGDLRKLQMVLGHENISTTAHYLQFSPTEIRDEYEKIMGEANEIGK